MRDEILVILKKTNFEEVILLIIFLLNIAQTIIYYLIELNKVTSLVTEM